MLISDRLFEILKEKGISQKDFSIKSGIPQSTISDWKRRHINPGADKIMIICNVLGIHPYDLLCGTEGEKYEVPDHVYINRNDPEYFLIETYRSTDEMTKGRLIGYAEALRKLN